MEQSANVLQDRLEASEIALFYRDVRGNAGLSSGKDLRPTAPALDPTGRE
jgi:hypothetical protein